MGRHCWPEATGCCRAKKHLEMTRAGGGHCHGPGERRWWSPHLARAEDWAGGDQVRGMGPQRATSTCLRGAECGLLGQPVSKWGQGLASPLSSVLPPELGGDRLAFSDLEVCLVEMNCEASPGPILSQVLCPQHSQDGPLLCPGSGSSDLLRPLEGAPWVHLQRAAPAVWEATCKADCRLVLGTAWNSTAVCPDPWAQSPGHRLQTQ